MSTAAKKKTFLEVFKKNAGNISISCQKSGIDRSTYYDWMEKDAKFKTKVEDINESLLDFSESKMFKAISEDNWKAIEFHLLTKGKSRGYVLKTQSEISGGLHITGIEVEIVHSKFEKNNEA